MSFDRPVGGDRAASAREPSADFYRVVAVVVVVVGHWLVSAVTYRDSEFGNDYPLDVMPWTRWLTLVFQVVPVFFLVGGYANGASWARWRESRDRLAYPSQLGRSDYLINIFVSATCFFREACP